MKPWIFCFLKVCIFPIWHSFHLWLHESQLLSPPIPLWCHPPWSKMQVMHWLIWSLAHANWLGSAHTLIDQSPAAKHNGQWLSSPRFFSYSLFWISALFSVTGFQKTRRKRMGRWRNQMNLMSSGMQISWGLFVSLCCTTLPSSLLLPKCLNRGWCSCC